MLPPGGRIAVALSGGPDSVALLHLLRVLEAEGALVVAGTAHFNHRLRGEAADWRAARWKTDAARRSPAAGRRKARRRWS